MNAPVTITATQSYSWVLREVFIAALQRWPYFSTFTIRRTPQLPGQTDQIPLLGVYILDESMAPDGDANAGEIRFIHSCRLGFQAIIRNNDPPASEQKLDEIFWAIMNVLWRDQYILNMLDTFNPNLGAGNPDNTRIEGISRGVRRHKWGASGAANETPIAELQYDVTFTYRSNWPPEITDDLLRIHLETAFPLGGTPEEIAAVQQVVVEYNFTPEQEDRDG
jgi:hypothetical protein